MRAMLLELALTTTPHEGSLNKLMVVSTLNTNRGWGIEF